MVVILSREHNTKINLVMKSWADKRRKCKYVNSPSLRHIGEMEVKLPGFLTSAPYGCKMWVSSFALCLNISNFESPLYAFLANSILHCEFVRGHSVGCNRTQCRLQQDTVSAATRHSVGYNRTQCRLQQDTVSAATGHSVGCKRTQCQLQQYTVSAATGHSVGCNRTQCRLQQDTVSAATIHSVGCNRTQCRLQQYTVSAATIHSVGCNRTQCRLQQDTWCLFHRENDTSRTQVSVTWDKRSLTWDAEQQSEWDSRFTQRFCERIWIFCKVTELGVFETREPQRRTLRASCINKDICQSANRYWNQIWQHGSPSFSELLFCPFRKK